MAAPMTWAPSPWPAKQEGNKTRRLLKQRKGLEPQVNNKQVMSLNTPVSSCTVPFPVS